MCDGIVATSHDASMPPVTCALIVATFHQSPDVDEPSLFMSGKAV